MNTMKSDKIINWIAAAGALYFVGTAIAGAIKRKREGVEGIGKLKRRIYSEMYELQKAGVPLNVKWSDLDANEQKRAEKVAHNSGYVQPQSSTKTYGEAFYNSLHRAYNAIAGTDLPYQESIVENENGDPIIIYRDYGTEESKQRRALDWWETSVRLYGDYDDAYRAALLYLAEGGKLVWSKEPGGVLQECFATATNAAGERKARISYLASEAKGGITILRLAHNIFEHHAIDDTIARDAICEVVRNFESKAAARQYIYDMYIEAHTKQDPGEDLPF